MQKFSFPVCSDLGTRQVTECGREYTAVRSGERSTAFSVFPAEIRTTSRVRSLSSRTAYDSRAILPRLADAGCAYTCGARMSLERRAPAALSFCTAGAAAGGQ